MRILCVSQQLPGPLSPIAALLAKNGDNTVLMASMRHRAHATPEAVRRVVLKKCNVEKYEKNYIGYLELAMRTAQNAANAWDALLADGFSPDLILACATNGTAFSLCHKFCDSFIVNYADASLANLARNKSGILEARQFISDIQMKECHLRVEYGAQSGEHAGDGSALSMPCCVDLEFFRPAQAAGQKSLLVFCGAMPHFNLNAVLDYLGRLLRDDPSVHIALLAANALQPVAAPDFLARYPEAVRSRIKVLNNLQPDEWLVRIQESAAAICLGLDACSMPAFLQIMACGLPIGVSQSEKAPGALLPFTFALAEKPDSWAASIARAMEKGNPMSAQARQILYKTCDQAKILPAHLERIFACRREWLSRSAAQM